MVMENLNMKSDKLKSLLAKLEERYQKLGSAKEFEIMSEPVSMTLKGGNYPVNSNGSCSGNWQCSGNNSCNGNSGCSANDGCNGNATCSANEGCINH